MESKSHAHTFDPLAELHLRAVCGQLSSLCDLKPNKQAVTDNRGTLLKCSHFHSFRHEINFVRVSIFICFLIVVMCFLDFRDLLFSFM